MARPVGRVPSPYRVQQTTFHRRRIESRRNWQGKGRRESTTGMPCFFSPLSSHLTPSTIMQVSRTMYVLLIVQQTSRHPIKASPVLNPNLPPGRPSFHVGEGAEFNKNVLDDMPPSRSSAYRSLSLSLTSPQYYRAGVIARYSSSLEEEAAVL